MKSEPILSEETTLLSNGASVRNYRDFERQRNRAKIADLIRGRFTERYITPIEAAAADKKHGFCTMAISCLMIEALESFRKGWSDSNGHSKDAFQSSSKGTMNSEESRQIGSTSTFDAEFCIRLRRRAGGGLFATARSSIHRHLRSTPRTFTAPWGISWTHIAQSWRTKSGRVNYGKIVAKK